MGIECKDGYLPPQHESCPIGDIKGRNGCCHPGQCNAGGYRPGSDSCAYGHKISSDMCCHPIQCKGGYLPPAENPCSYGYKSSNGCCYPVKCPGGYMPEQNTQCTNDCNYVGGCCIYLNQNVGHQNVGNQNVGHQNGGNHNSGNQNVGHQNGHNTCKFGGVPAGGNTEGMDLWLDGCYYARALYCMSKTQTCPHYPAVNWSPEDDNPADYCCYRDCAYKAVWKEGGICALWKAKHGRKHKGCCMDDI